MNILVMNGSPRGNRSNTKKISDYFLKGIKEVNADVNITEYNLNNKEVKACLGCFGCWNNSERACVLKDDMAEMLNTYIEADLIIWSTPLYHHTMTSLTKKFIERTLPVSSPLIMHDGEKYTHPSVYDKAEKQKHMLISTCGFPEYHNFNTIKSDFNRITEGQVVEDICCVMGELLSQNGVENIITWYFNAVKQAGVDFAENGLISTEIREKLKQPLIDIESFIGMANENWDGHDFSDIDPHAGKNTPKGKGYKFLSQMRYVFNKNNNLNLDFKLEFEFTDTKENAFFTINRNSIDINSGTTADPELKIITTTDNWIKVSNGEVDGAQAIMDGLYKVEGDMSLLMKMDVLFSGTESAVVEKKKEKAKFYGIKGSSWMGITFIPWTISWLLLRFDSTIATVVPLLLSLVVLILKKRVRAVSFFDNMSMFHFAALTILNIFKPEIVSSYGAFIHYFSMALIWGTSVFNNSCLTAEYSIHDEEEDLAGNPIFDSTNQILTLFWAIIFAVQGFAMIALNNMGLGKFSMLMLIVLFPADRFTKFFAKWYPEYLLKGGKVRIN